MQEFAQQQLGVAKQEAARRSLREGLVTQSGQEGLEAGAAIDPNATPEQKLAQLEQMKQEVGFFGGDRAKAFNKGLMASYQANVLNDVRKAVTLAEMDNPSDSAGYRNQVNAELAGLRETVDPAILPELVSSFNSQATMAGLRVENNERVRIRQEQLDSLNTTIANARETGSQHARNGDTGSSAQAEMEIHKHAIRGAESGIYTPGQAYNTIQGTNKEFSEAAYMGGIDRMANDLTLDEDGNVIAGPTAAYAALDALPETPPKMQPVTVRTPDGKTVEVQVEYTQEEWDDFKSRVGAQIKDIESVQEKAQADLTHQKEIDITFFSQAAKHGQISFEDTVAGANKKLRDGEITREKHESIINSSLNYWSKEGEKIKDWSAVDKRLAGDDRIVVDSQLADDYYDERYLPTIAGADPVEQMGKKLEYVERLKQVPDTLHKEVLTMLRSNNPDLIAEAAKFIDQVDSIPGLVRRTFNEQDRADAENIVSLSANMAIEEAIVLNEEMKRDPNRAKQRETIIREGKWHEDYREEVNDMFATGLFADIGFTGENLSAVNEDQITAEYGQLVEAHFIAGMSEEGAKAKARQLIARDWGVTEVTGEVMKHPFEAFYAVDGSVEYVREQAMQDIVPHMAGLEDFFPEGLKPSNIYFRPTKQADKLATKNTPTYHIVLLTDEGDVIPFFEPPTLEGKKSGGWMPDKQAQIDRVIAQTEAKLAEKERKKEFLKQPQQTMPFVGGF
jgi:hypothetical protein